MAKKHKTCNLEEIPIPDPSTKPYKRWVRKERLAYLVAETMRLGSSRLISRTNMAQQFGVSIPVICTDIKQVDAYIGRSMSGERATSMLYTSFQTAHAELVAGGQHAAAYKLARDFCDYLQTLGVITKAADELVVDFKAGNINIVFTNTDATACLQPPEEEQD